MLSGSIPHMHQRTDASFGRMHAGTGKPYVATSVTRGTGNADTSLTKEADAEAGGRTGFEGNSLNIHDGRLNCEASALKVHS